MRIRSSIFLFLWIALFSCKKPVLNDTNLIPEDELGLITTDTITIQTFTVVEDSISVQAEGVNKVVGTFKDNVFGNTYAGFYAQFYPLVGTAFEDTFIYVSLVLSMKYDFTYGDISANQTLQVYQLLERIYADKVYYSNTSLSTDNSLFGEIEFNPTVEDSVVRIILDPSRTVGPAIMHPANPTALNDTAEFYSNVFKGLYITCDTTKDGKGLIFFKSSNADIRITLYYQEFEGGPVRSREFPMNIRGNLNGSINKYRHDYSGSTAEPFINPVDLPPNSGDGDSITFIKPLAGLNTKIFVPYISNLGDVTIVKADLVIKSLTPLDNVIFPVSQNLTVSASDAQGNQFGLEDQLFFGGGKVSSDSAGIYTYKFNLARYYQSVSYGFNDDFGIFILPANRTRVGNMGILGGGNHLDDAMRMKLIVTYTKIE